jgi:hypothetical protein
MPPSRRQYSLADLVFAVTFCGLVAAFVRWFLGLLGPGGDFRFTTFLAIEFGFATWFLIWGAVRARRRAVSCPECGAPVAPPRRGAAPKSCQNCRQQALDPRQLRKERAKNVRTIVVSLASTSALLGLVLSGAARLRFEAPFWVVFPLVTAGVALGLVVLFFLIVVPYAILRQRRYRTVERVVALARSVAGEGTITEDGATTFWASGPGDPVPMLRSQRDAVQARARSLLDAPADEGRPLVVLCFERRASFAAFHRRRSLDPGHLTGLYQPGPPRTVSLSLGAEAHRLSDPERTARMLFAYHAMAGHEGIRPASWLQQGIANVLARSGEPDELDRLHRKILAALAGGQALSSTDLFRLKGRSLLRWARTWQDHANFARFAQYNAQSWSIVAYLGVDDAPDDRRARFRAFLGELRRRVSDLEEVFRRHFGQGYDDLLRDWQTWVRSRVLGPHRAPPPTIRDALVERVIPAAGDPERPVMRRIQAIRDVGAAGYVLGADALIDLLRDPDELIREAAVWSLESISGLALGADAGRWAAWWAELPPEATDVAGAPGRAPDGYGLSNGEG